MQSARECIDFALEGEAKGWSWPEPLQSASAHALFGGGKRIRPIVALLSADALGKDRGLVVPWAMAIELVHTYSLVHDDLPAMDDDDERRGQPTVHVAFDEATAILAGDALLTRAFGVLTDGSLEAATALRLVSLLQCAAGGQGMVGGQVHDIGGQLTDLAAVERMQRLKTGMLIQISAEGAGIATGTSDGNISALRDYGRCLGLLFQITDDVLDREQDAASGGNNLLHHLTMDEVLAYRDRTATEALAAIDGAEMDGQHLIELIDNIRERTV